MIASFIYAAFSLFYSTALAAPTVSLDDRGPFSVYPSGKLAGLLLTVLILPADPECEKFCSLVHFDGNAAAPTVTFTTENSFWFAHFTGKKYRAVVDERHEVVDAGNIGFVAEGSQKAARNLKPLRVGANRSNDGRLELEFSTFPGFEVSTRSLFGGDLGTLNGKATVFESTSNTRGYTSPYKMRVA